MNKSEVVITMCQTKNGKLLCEVTQEPHRKSKAIKLFLGKCLDNKDIEVEDLFSYLKESKHLNLVHLIKYAFNRGD